MPPPCRDQWNPQLYGQFHSERSQPFYDLLALVDRPLARHGTAPVQAVDLGCGTGDLTRALFDLLQQDADGQLRMLGLDNSPAMLEHSSAVACLGLEFHRATIESFAHAGPDGHINQDTSGGEQHWNLIFANAALQWVEDHELLFPALCARLAPQGQLAVQMPCNDRHPAYLLAAALAAEPSFALPLGGYVRHTPVQPPEWYASALYALGLARIQVHVKVYLHELADAGQVAQWVKGTLLNNYTSRLDEQTAQAYLAEYTRRLPQVLGDRRPYLFTFNRLFIHGVRS